MGLLISNYSTRNIFVWNNRYNSITLNYTAGGSDVNLLAGMLIGRIGSTGKAVQSVSTATDGSQVPIGILVQNYLIPAGTTVGIEIGIAGDVDLNALIFAGSPADTINTQITQDSGNVQMGTVGDILNGKGILPISSTEMTYEDNQ